MDDLPPFEAVKRFQSYFVNYEREYDSIILGRECHLNGSGNLHGGVIASLIVAGSSFAIASAGCYATGVATDLNVSYLSSANEATSLLLTQLALDWKDQVIIAQGRHTKFVAQAFALQQKAQQSKL
ncbi:hypothetical protein BDF22DRAFT_775297 [Syncephalis plumigaleata]|nr:hypothetical protein BDF22DRAFT_775297 [Syncephalis plumigaleata]